MFTQDPKEVPMIVKLCYVCYVLLFCADVKACLECLEEVADANLGSETLGLVLNLYCMVEALLILSPTVLRVLDSHDLKPPGKAESCWRAYNSESGKVDSLCAAEMTRSNYDQTFQYIPIKSNSSNS